MSHAKGLRHLQKSDLKLAALIKTVGKPTLKPTPGVSPYEALIESVVYQQLHGNAAKAIFGRVLAHFGGANLPPPEKLLQAAPEALRKCGLSANKLNTIFRIAQATVDGTIPSEAEALTLSDEELITRLTSIKGIGPWTVQMVLIFSLGRPDVLPTGDYGVRSGFQLLYKKRKQPTPKELEKYGEIWRPYRSIASWYMWRATEVFKKPKVKSKEKPVRKKTAQKKSAVKKKPLRSQP